MTAVTVTVAEARNDSSRIADQVNCSCREVVAFRHSKPWVKISPMTAIDGEAEYVDVMDAIIARGLADCESGNYAAGIEAARAEVDRRAPRWPFWRSYILAGNQTMVSAYDDDDATSNAGRRIARYLGLLHDKNYCGTK